MESEFVTCKICGIKFKAITHTHLSYKHDITLKEYKNKYSREVGHIGLRRGTIVVREDTRRKISDKIKKSWTSGRRREQSRRISGKSNPTKDPTVARKISEFRKGMVFTKEHRRNISKRVKEWHRGHRHPSKGKNIISEEGRRRLSELNKGKQFYRKPRKCRICGRTFIQRQKYAAHARSHQMAVLGNPAKLLEVRRKIRNKVIEAYRRGVYHKKPTNLERKIIEVCKRNFLPYKYVGDGKLWIVGKNPDFVHLNKRVVVEVLGNYWHNQNEFNQRKEKLENAGWKVIGLWEDEIIGSTEELLVSKLVGEQT